MCILHITLALETFVSIIDFLCNVIVCYIYYTIYAVNTTHCNNRHFFSGAGLTFPQCIPNSWVCDGDRGRRNNADETDCGMYRDSITSHIRSVHITKLLGYEIFSHIFLPKILRHVT